MGKKITCKMIGYEYEQVQMKQDKDKIIKLDEDNIHEKYYCDNCGASVNPAAIYSDGKSKWYCRDCFNEIEFDVYEIHGTNRCYHLVVDGVERETKFEIAGWGVTRKDIEDEKRFRRWCDIAPTISVYSWDEMF